MGYYLSANTADGSRLTGFRVGTNGSQDFLAAAVLSGYASGRFEHSDRIRGSWVQPMRGIAGMLPGVELPAHYDVRTRGGFSSWLEFAHDGCLWLEVNFDAMTIGRKLKPVTCPVLAGLLVWVDARNGEGDQIGRLDGPGVAHLADALEQVLPLTRPCTWHNLVAEFATTARAAANVRGSLVFG